MRKEDMFFIRWGNLNSVKHKEARGASDDEWVHVAPCYKGIYAFPRGYVERFLIGGSYGLHHKVAIKDGGNLVREKDFYEEDWETPKEKWKTFIQKNKIKMRDLTHIEKDGDSYMAYHTKPKRFKYEGYIWHHLGGYLDKKCILEERHGWHKTSYKDYLIALNKSDIDDRFQSYMRMNKGERHGNPHCHPNREEKDFYEVFIEHLK